MKKLILLLLILSIGLMLWLTGMVLQAQQTPETTEPTTIPTTQPTTEPTLPPTTAPTVPPTTAPVLDGWHTEDGVDRYYENGVPISGWKELDGQLHYFFSDGTYASGWVQIDENRYYFDEQGLACTGWLELETKRYYLNEDGTMQVGWLELEGIRYYFKEDGVMARGCVEIDGVNNYFTADGAYFLLVNPWNYIPEGYDPDLVALDKYNNYSDMRISRICYDDLMAMLKACRQEASKAVVVSAYRTHEFQTKNYNRKVQYYLDRGYDQEEAERRAARVVAVPGTSEHQLGLAVDIVDVNYPYLDDHQATMPAQKWLMEHCWEYGFVLRYPDDKTDVTGIIYEPWHYRYVGKELAAELYELGLTVEEYMQKLTEEAAQ